MEVFFWFAQLQHQNFARRVLELAEDPPTRREIEAGRFAFTRAKVAGSSARALESRGAKGAAIERGFVSERYVDSLPQGTSRLVIAKAVRLSPLARDRLRQRGIAIERMER